MKNCFKTMLALAAVAIAAGVSAQEDPQKETVIVDPFTYSAGASSTARDNVRSAVMSGFSNIGRFIVVDALTDSRLSNLYENRDAEDVINDENWKTESETAYKALGANKLLRGQVELLSLYKKLDDDGKWVYYCDLNFTLQVYNINDGTMTGSESYKYHELSTTSCDDAFNDAAKKTTKDMTQFCNKHFKMESYVLELGETDKKGVVKDLWILGGQNMGISNGTIFKVLAEKKIGPKTTRQQIGQVIAKEVTEDMTRCEIMDKKEAVVIQKMFNEAKAEDKVLHIELDRKRGDGMKGFGRMFGF